MRRRSLLLEDAGRSHWLSFYLPTDEANRLARVLRGRPCVPVFDLLGQVATAAGLEVVRAEIDGDARGVSAALVLSRGERVFKFGCHPADALALALRVGAPILASDVALAHACPADPELQARAVRRWLDQLRPTDFDDHGAGTE
jgi:bifunctional DNase/RNase